jgi:hypothetical protein
MNDYSFRVETDLDPQPLKEILSRYRPFRIEVAFSNGFSTREFGDDVQYLTREPLAKLHYFADALQIGPETRLLDIGSHLGYYGHHFLRAGIARYVGVEFDERIFGCATLLQWLSPYRRDSMRLLNLDFTAPYAREMLRSHGPYDAMISLASVNNMLSLTAALVTMAELAAPGGQIVLEYLALDRAEPLCSFHEAGYRGDGSLFWIFSQSFLDGFLGKLGITRERDLLEWENEAALGAGMKKIMTLYRKQA